MTIVETCAKAMRAIIWGRDWDDIGEPCRDLYREEVRAALRSVRPEDVSDGMVEAFFHEDNKGDPWQTRVRRAIAAAIAAGGE